MSLFKRKDKDGFPYYGYEFTRNGKRYCKTFLGLSKDEVAAKEANHKLAIRNGITLEEPNTLVHSYSVGVERFKEHANNYYTRPEECLYVLDSFAEIVGDKNLDEIELSDIKEYIKLRKGQVKNSTINRELNTIRKLFSVAVSENLILNNPCKDLKYLRIDNPPERYLGKEEQRQLLKVCSEIMQNIIIFALYTGMRENELLSLKWEDINFKENYLIARETKNNEPREIPMSFPVLEVLKKLPRLTGFVFTNPKTMTRYKNVYSNFTRAVERSRIKHITFHQLRHTTASRLNEIGVDVVTIQRILGHKSIKTTMKYLHNSNKSMVNAMKMLGESY